jgi:hypothetical protein
MFRISLIMSSRAKYAHVAMGKLRGSGVTTRRDTTFPFPTFSLGAFSFPLQTSLPCGNYAA